MMRKGFVESETVKMLLTVAVIVILIGVLILIRKQLGAGVGGFFDIWRR